MSTATLAPSEHVLSHLTPGQRRIALALTTPRTITDIAHELGLASRRSVEGSWIAIRDRLWIDGEEGGNTGTGAALRVALVRIMYGIDPCPCGRGDQ